MSIDVYYKIISVKHHYFLVQFLEDFDNIIRRNIRKENECYQNLAMKRSWDIYYIYCL